MILTPSERERLASVIGELEMQTSGEIRVIIARRSTPETQHLSEIFLLLSCIGLFAFAEIDHAAWMPIAWVILSALVASLISGSRVVQRWFLPKAMLHQSVWFRAELEFFREGLNQTRGRTGILIFLSLFERRAVVLADKGISDHVPAGTWDDVIRLLLTDVVQVSWAERLEAAVRQCGKILAQKFPPEANDRNELSNLVLIKD